MMQRRKQIEGPEDSRTSEPERRGAAWTEERGARDERRGKAVPQGRPGGEPGSTASRRGAAPPGLRSEEPATSDEGRRCLRGAPEASQEAQRAGGARRRLDYGARSPRRATR